VVLSPPQQLSSLSKRKQWTAGEEAHNHSARPKQPGELKVFTSPPHHLTNQQWIKALEAEEGGKVE
jgi:hypothetical protein